MTIKAIIFDLDGTLVAMKLKSREAKEKFIQKIKEAGFDVKLLNPSMPSESMIQLLVTKYGISRDLLMRVLDECFQPYELEAAAEAELRPGAKEVIPKLKEIGYRLGVASNNGRMGVRLALEKLGILDYFDVIVARGDVDKMKPDGSPISECVRRLGVKPKETVYVGDAVIDIMAAKKAGVYAIGILGGFDSRETLEKNKPDYIIENLSELLHVLKNIEKDDLFRPR